MADVDEVIAMESSVPRWARRSIFVGLLAMDFTGFACYSVMGPFFPVEVKKKKKKPITLLTSQFSLMSVLIFCRTSFFI
jgi:hypothetical protein